MQDVAGDGSGSGRPATVSGGVKVAVTFVAAVTLVVVVALLRGIEAELTPWRQSPTVGQIAWGLTMCTVLALFAVGSVRGVSWWARSAIVLAIVHLGLLIAVACAWYGASGDGRPPLVDEVPVHWYGVRLGLAMIVLAVVAIGRRGVPTWFQAVVAFAIVFVVVLGAWLPMLASFAADNPRLDADEIARDALPYALAVPAIVAALAALLVVVAEPGRAPSRATKTLALGGVALLYALALQSLRDEGWAPRVHANLVHVLAGGVAFAWGALVALAIAHLRSLRTLRHDVRRPPPWVQDGVVVAEDEHASGPAAVARLHFAGWLAGFRVTSERFRLRTRAGELPVPPGASVRVSLSPASTAMARGDAHVIVAAGQHVRVSGFVEPPASGPFRDHRAPVAGSSGLVVISDDGVGSARRDVVLALWRPCLLFLLASTLAALPIVAAW